MARAKHVGATFFPHTEHFFHLPIEALRAADTYHGVRLGTGERICCQRSTSSARESDGQELTPFCGVDGKC